MTVHIQGPGHLLCGPRNDPPKGDWVYTMAPAERFRTVTCAACLRAQIAQCSARAFLATYECNAEIERHTEGVCRDALSALCAMEAS